MNTDPVFTCQICGRAIKANTGLIAHHGYQRPYNQGWQTRSCFGARRVPFEHGHDAIDDYLVLLVQWITDAQKAFAEMVSAPPATLTYQRRDGWHNKVGEPIVYEKPADFDYTKALRNSMMRGSYETEWRDKYKNQERGLRGLENDQRELTKRLTEWKEAA